MTQTITITGYIESAECTHCNRTLRHGIRVDDGGTVGAACLANKITARRRDYTGRTYRMATDTVIHVAKVVQRAPADRWYDYGVSESMLTFERAR
jgi:hypothetical protein